MLSWNSHLWSFRKYRLQITCGRTLSTLTSSAYVELFVFIFIAVLNVGPASSHGHEATSMNPHVLVYCKYCIKYHFISPDLFIYRMSDRPMEPYLYFMTISSFFQLSTSGSTTILHRKKISNGMSGCDCFYMYNSCATRCWKKYVSVWDNLAASSAV